MAAREGAHRHELRPRAQAFPDIPFAADVRAYCLDLPDAWEDYPWGDIVFKVGTKLFAGVGHDAPLTVTVKATPEDAEELIEFPHITTAPYVGRYGWVSVAIQDEATLDQALALIEMSYELVRKGTRARRGRTEP
jgi:predicted DNA-binding protein (MmcQ/YjbR family)